MVAHKIEIAPELIAEGRRLHDTTLTPLCDIAAVMGITRGTLSARIREWAWGKRRASSGALDLFHAVRGAAAAVATETLPQITASSTPLAERRAVLAERFLTITEREMAVVERVIGILKPTDQAEAERTMRTLATVSRVVREAAALNMPDEVTPDDPDDDAIPLDIDEFRLELARRIRGLIEKHRGNEGEGAGGTGARLEAPRTGDGE